MFKYSKALMPLIITCVVAGSVLAILAPLGTDGIKLPWRYVFWIGLCLVGGIGAGITDVLAKLFKLELNNWQCALGQSFTASLAVSAVIFIGTLLNYGLPNWSQFFSILFYVWVISAAISLIGALIRKNKINVDTASKRPALYERLPPHLRSADIYALAAEDHYVRVITARGDELVLMRLSDAIRETAPLKGLSPHRSWWVAEAGVDNIKKSEIILRTEQTVPISRTGMKLVREAGWK